MTLADDLREIMRQTMLNEQERIASSPAATQLAAAKLEQDLALDAYVEARGERTTISTPEQRACVRRIQDAIDRWCVVKTAIREGRLR